jgi:hypothetical protein
LNNTKAQQEAIKKRRIKIDPIAIDKLIVEQQRIEDNFMSLVLMRRTLRNFTDIIEPDMLINDNARSLLIYLKQNKDFDGKNIDKVVQNLQNYVKILSLLYEELYQNLELNELHEEVSRLQARLIEIYVKTKKSKIIEKLQTASEETTRDLLNKAKKYDQLLNQVKGA